MVDVRDNPNPAMHPLLAQGSFEASRLYDSVPDVGLDWSKLRVSSLHKHFQNPEFLSVLKNGTKAISVSKFRSSFIEVVMGVKPLLCGKKWFAVLVSCKEDDEVFSRSLYFFLMALSVCPDIAISLEGILKLPKEFHLSDKFTDFTYVCFDDMIHSAATIESCYRPVSNMPRIVVAPYVSDVAKENLGNIGVKVVHADVVRQFVKIDPGRSNTVDFKYDAYPLFLNHRSFNTVQGFPEIYSRLAATRRPPYSASKYSMYEYLVGDIVSKFVA